MAALRVLHVQGPEQQGGAAQAARSVRELLPWVEHLVLSRTPKPWQQAVCTIGGFVEPLLVRHLRELICAAQPDVVHLHRFSDWGAAAIVAAKREGVPVVYSAYDYWALGPCANCYSPERPCDMHCARCYRPKDCRWPRIANVALLGRRRRILHHLNQVDRVIALSQHSEAFLREHGVTAPISVIPVPVTVPDLGHVERVPERVPERVLFVGWMSPNKGAHIFLEAVRLLHEQGVELDARMIGPRTRLDYPPSVPPYVEWRQTASREETMREIAAASVLVCCEQWPNPQPLVVCEAMLLGTLVIASDVGGIPELVSVNRRPRALLFPAGDATACARQIARSLEWYSLEYATERARSHIDNYLSPARLRPLFEEAYHAATAAL